MTLAIYGTPIDNIIMPEYLFFFRS